MTTMKGGLVDYSPQSREVLLGDDTFLPILGVGNLGIIPNGSSGSYTLGVLHVPRLCYNLL